MKSATNYSGKTRWNGHGAASSPLVGDALAPLIEGPIPENEYELLDDAKHHEGSSSWWVNMRSWMKTHGKKRSDPRILLGVLGCPLSPVPVPTLSSDQLSISIKNLSMVCSDPAASLYGASPCKCASLVLSLGLHPQMYVLLYGSSQKCGVSKSGLL
jgi:hypothetical protein